MAEFRRILATAEALDALLEPPETELLPRPFGGYTLLREIVERLTAVISRSEVREGRADQP